jgi:hypothetical protein
MRSRENQDPSQKSVILSEASEYVAPAFGRNKQLRRESNGPAFPLRMFPQLRRWEKKRTSRFVCHPDAKRKDLRLFFSGASPISTSHAPPKLNKPPLYQGHDLSLP